MGLLEFVAGLVPSRDYTEIRGLHFDDEGEPVATATVVRSMAARTIGLLGRTGLPFNEAMCFIAENGIHTNGMKFDLDLLFVSMHGEDASGVLRGAVLQSEEFVPPGTVRTNRSANAVIEFAGGAFRRYGFRVPSKIRLSHRLPVVQTSFLHIEDRRG